MNRSIKQIGFNSTFYDEHKLSQDDEENLQFVKDKDLGQKLVNMKYSFIELLCEYGQRYMKSKHLADEPTEVQEETKNLIKQNDKFYTWFDNHFQGFFESQNGSSRIIKNPLSEADIINAPQSTMTTNANVSRMVGSGFFKSLGSKLTTLIKNNKPLISAMKHALKSGHLGETAELVGDFLEKKGYGQTGGGQTGGSHTGGKKKKALLSRLM